MEKTKLMILAGGVVFGTAIGWMAASGSSPESVPVALATKTNRPTPASTAREIANADEKRPTKRERPENRDKLADLKPGESKATAKAFTMKPGEEMTAEMKEIFAKIDEQRKEARARKVDERLAALKSRLNLTADQEAKVRSILEGSANAGSGGMSLLSSPADGSAGKASVLSLGGGGGSLSGSESDKQIAELLSPEQQGEFATFQQERRENQVEIATNGEMLKLQQQLTLTPEQKDQAFQALGDISRKEAENPQKELDMEGILAAKQARVDALRPILTPEQLKAFESNPSMALGAHSEVSMMPEVGAMQSVILESNE